MILQVWVSLPCTPSGHTKIAGIYECSPPSKLWYYSLLIHTLIAKDTNKQCSKPLLVVGDCNWQ